MEQLKEGGYIYHEVSELNECSWIEDGKKECLGHTEKELREEGRRVS